MSATRIFRLGTAAALVFALGVTSAACGTTADAATAAAPAPVSIPTSPETFDPTPAVVAAGVTPVEAAAGVGLTAAQVEGLFWMREEEKLAHDVYLAMFDLWGLEVFENIAASEARHMDAVLGLIEAYALADPVAQAAPGVFMDPELAGLYDELVARGSSSPIAALTVGALIEDLDILDLEELLAVTDRADIARVYGNLMRGSQNHLRAFTALLAAEGAEYEPVYHSAEEIAALIAGAAGGSAGRRRGMGHSSG